MQRLLFIIPHRSDGGTQRVVSNWANQMAKNSIDIHIIQFYHGANEFKLCTGVNVHVLSSGDPGDYKRQSITTKLMRLRGAVKGIAPDAIVAFLGTTGSKAMLSVLGLGVPVFTTVRNNPRYFGSNGLDRWIRNVSILMSKGCLVQTQTQLQYLPVWIRHKTKVLPNPVSNELTLIYKSYHQTCRLIVAAGRLVRQKNYPLLIRAFARVQGMYPHLLLHIYGEGELRTYLQSMINQLGLASSILLMGRSDELWAAFSRADLFVLSSDFEGMPNVLMEAMAIGLPCIATDCPTGPSELITNRRNGMLVPTGDEAELAKAILYMVENPDAGREMGEKARQEILELYSLLTNTEELLSYLNATKQ